MKTLPSQSGRLVLPSAGWRDLRRSGLVAGVGVLLLLGLAGSAAAAGTSTSATAGSSTGTGANSVAPAVAQTSDDEAGYFVTPSHAFASASATFVVPKVTCTSTFTEQYFGLLDVNPAGGSGGDVLATVLAECDSGKIAYYYDAYQSGKGTVEPGIHAGDTVEVSVYQTGNIEEAKVFDITANHYWDAYDSPIPDTSMMIGEYSDVPTAQTAKVSFTQVQVNGQFLSFEPSTEYDLVDGSTTLVSPSAVPVNGDSFNLSFDQTATAAATAATTSGGTTAGSAPNGVQPAQAQSSSAEAGYYVTPAHAFASASATFVVPEIICTQAATTQFFGLTDVDPATNSGGSVTAAVSATCDSGQATYYYDAQQGSEGQAEPGINVGDTVEVSVYQTGNIEEAKVFDITANHYWDAYAPPIPDTSMMIGELSVVTTSETAKVSFNQVQVNGQYLSFEPNTEYNMVSGSTKLIKTSAVPFDGDSFNLKFEATS